MDITTCRSSSSYAAILLVKCIHFFINFPMAETACIRQLLFRKLSLLAINPSHSAKSGYIKFILLHQMSNRTDSLSSYSCACVLRYTTRARAHHRALGSCLCKKLVLNKGGCLLYFLVIVLEI